MDTIFALATAQGRAGVAVIRISGLQAKGVASDLIGTVPGARKAALRVVRDADGQALDQALVLSFAAPNSFTGEDVVELHLHGSPAVVSAVLRALSQTSARLAEPGEFTRRALAHDRMDLVQVEALGDLIAAETEAQRRQAMQGFDGAFSTQVELWRSKIIRAAALIEATIDFADEDVPVDVTPEVTSLLEDVLIDIQSTVSGIAVAERVRHGFEVAIIGRPNAGKSTLLNALAKREAAITSDVAGTTRDVIEVRMDLDGLPVTILDTAGLRETSDTVEAIGVSRAVERAERADIRVFLQDEGDVLPVRVEADDIILRPKADLLPDQVDGISGLTGAGVSELLERLKSLLTGRMAVSGLATRERHRVALSDAAANIQNALTRISMGPDVYDVVAEDIRLAARSLEVLVGRIDVENLLDEIFASFCLGK